MDYVHLQLRLRREYLYRLLRGLEGPAAQNLERVGLRLHIRDEINWISNLLSKIDASYGEA